MLMLKACPRCRGDLVLEAALGEPELVCLQCAHRVSARNASGPPVSGRGMFPNSIGSRPALAGV